jgi:hypothetical protein
MKKVSIAINVIMGLMIVFLLYRINKTDNRFLEIQKYVESQDSLKVKNMESNKSKEISKVDFTKAKLQTLAFIQRNNGQSPIKLEEKTEVLYNPNKLNITDKIITKYYCEVDTTNFKFYYHSKTTKEWRIVDSKLELFALFLNPKMDITRIKVLKPNEDPNTAKDLRERK